MKLEGTSDFPFTPTVVWDALHDVDVLAKAVPGCNFIKVKPDGSYFASVSLGMKSFARFF